MMNLLPTQRKDDIRAARANVIILRYVAIVALAFLFLLGALYASHSILKATMKDNEEIVALNDVKADVFRDTQQQVAALSAQLSDAKDALDQEVRYSQVLVKIGQLMPAGTVLDDLQLDADSFNNSPIEITAYAKSNAEASALQTQFQNSRLFSQVSINSTEESDTFDAYPVKVSLSAVIRKTGL